MMYNDFYYPIKRTKENEKYILSVQREAEKMYNEPIKSLLYSEFKIFDEKGSRVEFEQSYMRHRKMFCAFSVMALLGEDEKWTDKLCDIIWAICDEFTWALPAHVGGMTDADAIAERIDLFAAETAFEISEVVYILKDVLPKRVVSRVKYEIKRRIADPYVKHRYEYGKSNWAGVCISGITASMIYMGFDDELKTVKNDILKNAGIYLSSFLDDGCCLEGALYWDYGFSFFCFFAELMRQYTNGEINFFENDKVRRIAHFGEDSYIEGNDVIPFSDSPHKSDFDYGFRKFLSDKYGDISVPDKKYMALFGSDVRYRFTKILRTLYALSGSEAKSPKASNADCRYYPDAMWYINKSFSYKFAAKGGKNKEPHNHNDVGSFIVYDEGKFILDDPGWPVYDKYYFTDVRYENMCASSLGHSVPIICEKAQMPGEDKRAVLVSESKNEFAIEFSSAYGDEIKGSLIRKFDLFSNRIEISDSYDGEPSRFTERFITRIKPILSENEVIIDNWHLSCDKNSEIQISSFEYTPRFSGKDGCEDAIETAYIIDFQFRDFASARFVLKKAVDSKVAPTAL